MSARGLTIARRALLALAAVLVAVLVAVGLASRPATSAGSALADNPDLDAGTALSGPAPGFTLTDQFGRRVSLHSLRGRVVLLAFTDSRCTTVCPLTTTEILDARRLLGAAGARVQLLGVDANPTATTVADVRAYSQAHGMLDQWEFLTGSPARLRAVWRAYHIDVQIEHGQIDHTPALYAIDARGRLARVYLTEMAYAGVQQQAQLLAQELSRLLPGHPPVRSSLSYSQIQPIAPTQRIALPAVASGGASEGAGQADGARASVSLGPDGAARLLLFFATWDAQAGDLRAGLEGLDRYAALSAHASGGAGRAGAAGAAGAAGVSGVSTPLPALSAIDEGSVEPSPAALPALLGSLGRPLAYPVAVDGSGRVADGYEVEDEPWLVLVSATGQILWHDDVSTSGWPSTAALARDVRGALAHPSPPPPSAIAAARRRLAGSAVPLAALHAQAGRLIVGGSAGLGARLRELRGYPVVVDVWASWCTSCQAEFPLLAAASALYGRRVAFLGADVEDQAGSARAWLAEHPVSYPSYEASLQALRPLALISALPTTIFIAPSGRVTHVHIGQYEAQGSLDQEIASYAG